MRIAPAATALMLGLSCVPAAGQTIVPCSGLIDVTMISEPWESYSRSYAQGAIRIFEAYVSPTIAAGAVIGVIHPVPGDPYPLRNCSAVVHADPNSPYFAEAMVSQSGAVYDPARGLILSVPVRFPDGAQPIRMVEITVNQATGTVVER